MNKYLTVLLTCAWSLNLYGKNNPELGNAIEKADLPAFYNIFINNKTSVNDTFEDKPILNHAIRVYINSLVYESPKRQKDLEEMIDFLLKNNAPINLVDKDGNTALHAAASVKDFLLKPTKIKQLEDLIASLMQNGFDINAQNNDGNTPLHTAAATGLSPKTVALLLKNGAKTDIENNDRRTAYAIADENADDDISFQVKDIFDKHLQAINFTKVLQAEKEKPYKTFKDFSVTFE